VADALAVEDVEDDVIETDEELELEETELVDETEEELEDFVLDEETEELLEDFELDDETEEELDEEEAEEVEEEEDETERGAVRYWNIVSLYEPPQISPGLPRQVISHPALPSGAGPFPFWIVLPQKHCCWYSVPE
jgi:hypothetical protein